MKKLIIGLLIAMCLTACGGDKTLSGSGSSSSSSSSSGIPGTTANVAVVTISTSTNTIPSDGSTAATISAIVRDASNNLLSGVPVTFTATSGGISGSPATTDSSGKATVTLSTAGDTTIRVIQVTATAGNFTANANVSVVAAGTSNTVAAVTVVSSTQSIPSDGSANATITAIVRDASNNLISGVPVTITASSGGIAGSPATSDVSGQAKVTLSTAGVSTPRTITVTATAGGISAQTAVNVASVSSSNSVQLGNGTGSGFVPNVIAISNANLSAGGSTSMTVSLVQSDGSLYSGSANISFNSPCIAAGTSSITGGTTATTTTGILTVTYVATGCTGADAVSATTTINSNSLSAAGTITVAAASIGSIAYISATPTNIALKGTGDANRPEVSTVVFKVLDNTNGPRPGATVTFALNTSVGGVALSAASATSDANGLVQTQVNAGTVATSVKVTATVTGTSPTISTQSSQLTVTTGIPTANSFSLAVGCFNIEGWNLDGITTSVTARLGDRFQNPVPDGTAVTFTAEGGNIQSQCTTATTTTEGGVCNVNFRSSNPRPSNGRVTLLAKAIGEESFTDSNGNGAFDNGESFVDLSEPYRDDNENLSYDPGEDFFDFNNNGVRDGGDSLFNGVLCNDTSGRCGNTASRSTGIGQTNYVILSGSTPSINVFNSSNVDVTGTSLNVPVSGAKAVSFWIRDLHDNVMPGGTTVSLSASGAGLGVATPSSFTVPCSAVAAGSVVSGITSFPFTITAGTTTGTGVVTLTVTSPSGVVTISQISVSVP